jgi:hypothetical protein
MKRNTRPNSVSADATRHRAVIATTIVVAALFVSLAAVEMAAAQADRPAVVVTNGTTTADGTTTVDIVLTNAPDGLSGYYFDVTVDEPDVAQIESASYPDRFALTSDPEIGANGASATLEAADLDGAVQSGSVDVTLITVTVSVLKPGEATLSVEPRQFDADDGTVFSPSTRPGVVTGSATDEGAATNDGADSDANPAGTSESNGAGVASDSGLSPVTPTVLAVAALAVLTIGLAALVVRRD